MYINRIEIERQKERGREWEIERKRKKERERRERNIKLPDFSKIINHSIEKTNQVIIY